MIANELRKIIRIVLIPNDLWSQDAEDLLIGTAIQESDRLKRVTQYGNGPAKSYFQIEPDTLDDLYDNYLAYHEDKWLILGKYWLPSLGREENLMCNLPYAIMAARLQYYRVSEAIPSTLEGQSEYWKKYWNTRLGKGSAPEYYDKVKDLI